MTHDEAVVILTEYITSQKQWSGYTLSYSYDSPSRTNVWSLLTPGGSGRQYSLNEYSSLSKLGHLINHFIDLYTYRNLPHPQVIHLEDGRSLNIQGNINHKKGLPVND